MLTAICGMARAYQSSGRRSEAIRLFEDALSKRRRRLGDNHPETLLTILETGECLRGRRADWKGGGPGPGVS